MEVREYPVLQTSFYGDGYAATLLVVDPIESDDRMMRETEVLGCLEFCFRQERDVSFFGLQEVDNFRLLAVPSWRSN